MKKRFRQFPAALFASAGLAAVLAISPPAAEPAAAGPHVAAVADARGEKPLMGYAAEWGIEVLGVRLTAAGTMLDFRFRVVDADKARPLVQKKTEAYLVDEASDKRLQVPNPPKVGRLRQTAMTAEEGRTYFAMFGNPGRMISPGDRVTVVIGDFRAEDLVVDGS